MFTTFMFTMPLPESPSDILSLVYAALKQATCLTADFSRVNRDPSTPVLRLHFQ